MLLSHIYVFLLSFVIVVVVFFCSDQSKRNDSAKHTPILNILFCSILYFNFRIPTHGAISFASVHYPLRRQKFSICQAFIPKSYTSKPKTRAHPRDTTPFPPLKIEQQPERTTAIQTEIPQQTKPKKKKTPFARASMSPTKTRCLYIYPSFHAIAQAKPTKTVPISKSLSFR